VSEESERVGSGPEGNGAGVDPTAVALALAGADRDEANAFLRDQRALIADQRHHLRRQFTELDLRIWEKRTGVLLRVATTVVGITFAAGLSYMVWDAAHSTGLIVEPFSVPSDMAAKGLSGQVVASQMLDKLAVMQDATDSVRPPQSYENNWGNNLKVEIPETGVSIGELQNFLKGWLGHDTHISGEVWRTQTGIAVTARESGEGGATFTGPESDLDGLMQKAAEHVYSITQPYRYANFLDRNYAAPDIADRAARATVIYHKLIAGPSALEQGWAWYGLGTIEVQVKRDIPMAVYYLQKSIAANQDSTLGHIALGGYLLTLGRYETSLSVSLKAKSLLDRSNAPNINPRYLSLNRLLVDHNIGSANGDYTDALHSSKIGAEAPEYNAILTRDLYTRDAVVALARLHDGGGISAYLLEMGITSIQKRFGSNNAILVARGLEDWPSVLQLEKATPESVKQIFYRNQPITLAITAIAHARVGDLKGAETLIAQCEADSDDCLIARGQIADMQDRRGRADYWFDRVERREPSAPFADAAWGKSLLARGQPDDAIEKFAASNRRGPHFADPLEGWGEALMAKNQSHLALAKFAEADKYAPNWGRLHLKWGEALYYAGKRDDAHAQFARAAQLDLTPSEKAELAVMSHV
jgi:tetratricopeptide (TPR) repeat protein